jgi:fibronectin-binding autotransporter adhesin
MKTALFAILALLLALVPGRAATLTWTGGGNNDNWSTAANWGGIVPSPGDSLIFTTTSRLINTNNFSPGTAFNGIAFEVPAGSFILNGNPITLGGDIVNNQFVTLQTINLALALSATRNVDVTADGSLAIAGVISGAGGLTKAGAGLLTLGAANTFGGALTVNAGTVGVSSDGNLGAAPASATAGKIALNNGTLRATSSFAINANRGITVGGEGTFEVGNGIILSYGGAIAGSGGLSKLRFGGLTLSGGNTYSGPTAVKNGTLTLDFAQAASPVNNVINPNSALSLGGATAGAGTTNFAALIMNGKADTANSQTFNGTTIALGQSQIRANSAGAGSARITLGALNRDLGGVVNIIPPRVVGGNGDITTTSGIENGIIGGWAMVSDGTVALQGGGTGNPIPPAVATNFATVDASGNVIAYTNYTEYAGGNLGDIAWGTNNIRIGSDLQGDILLNIADAGTTHDVNTITFSRGFNWGLNIGQGNTLRLGRRGALFSQHHSSSPTWGITSSAAAAGGQGNQDIGTLTAGGAPDTPGEIIIHLSQAGSGSANNFVIDCKVTDNGSAPVSIIKAGPGFFKLRGHNTYSGGTYVLQGRIQLSGSEVGTSNPDGIGTGPLYIFPGGYLFFAGTGSPITNKMYIAGDAARQEQGIGAIRTSGGWRVDGEVELIGDATIGGNGQLTGGIAGRITGPYSLTLCSGGTVNGSISISNPNNDWTGNTIIQARNNQGANTFSSGGDECIPHGFGKGNVALLGYSTGAITWNLNGFSETINGLSTPGNGPTCTILNNGGTLSTLTVGGNDQSGTFGGLINDGSGILALTKIGGGKQTITGANTYSGTTTVQGGTLALGSTGSIPNSQQITVTGAGTLDVTDVTGGFAHAFPIGLDNGTLALRNTVAPGLASLSMTNSRIRVTSVGGTPVTVDTSIFTTGGDSNVIDIASVGNVSGYPAQFTVIKYAGFIDGAGFNFVLGNVPTASTVGYISNNVANASVDLVLLDGPKALFWTGTANDNWDINTSVNWRAFGVTPSVFLDVDLVRFDDTAGAKTVNLTTTVLPSAVTVSNETATYTLGGLGKISGPTGLTKDGAGTLILNNSGTNDFFGPFTINAGTVQIGNNSANGSLGADGVINNANLTFARSDNATIANPISGSANGTLTQNGPGVLTLSGNSTFSGPVVVAQSTLKAGSAAAFGSADSPTTVNIGATLDVNGQNLSTEPIFVGGAGVGGNGALVNTGPDQLNAFRVVTLTDDVVFGGTTRWDIRTNAAGAGELRTEGRVHKITKVGSNQVSLVGVNVDPSLGDIEIREGTFSVQTTSSQVGEPAAALTVHGNATLGLFNLNANPLNKAITLRAGATLWNESGISVVNGQIVLEGTAIINAANAGTTPSLNVNAEFAGPGGLTKIGSGAMVMAGPFNAYTGPTVVSNGTLFVDGNYSDITTGSFTVHGGTLGGTGAIAAPVVINAGGALAPGGLSVPIATLTFGNTLSLGGTTRMDVGKTGGVFVNDFVFGVTTLQLGGTLQLNITGEPLVVGDVISLFNSTSASGNFSAITPSTPGPGLVWDTSNLAANGTLAVAAFTSRPEFGTVLQSAGAIVMNGSNGPPGATYYVLSSTNIATPLSQWLPVLTNAFDAGGNFSATNLIDPATPQRFFLLQTP